MGVHVCMSVCVLELHLFFDALTGVNRKNWQMLCGMCICVCACVMGICGIYGCVCECILDVCVCECVADVRVCECVVHVRVCECLVDVRVGCVYVFVNV